MKKPLSKLTKIDLRDVWGHEALDFTRWLSEQENLDLLSDEIGVIIKLVQTEANVGKFNVDILAEEEGTGRKIIIENQLEDTNHDHLGKIITYASGYDAELILWVVRDYREEHQKAIDWLNEHTDENIGFFLIKVELWQIENSNPAPKFEIVVSPNEWAKAIKGYPANGDLTNTKLQQLEFWTRFKNYVSSNNSKVKLRTPRPQHWYDISIGSSEAHVALTINTRENLMGCELYIDKNKEFFGFLQERKENIEKILEVKLDWTDANKASMIKTKAPADDLFNQEKQEEYFKWLLDQTIKFAKIFGKYIQEYKKSK